MKIFLKKWVPLMNHWHLLVYYIIQGRWILPMRKYMVRLLIQILECSILLVTNGVPGLQICREKSEQPQVWEDVPSKSGAFIVNIGDMMERWTNCLFRSTLHRVLPP